MLFMPRDFRYYLNILFEMTSTRPFTGSGDKQRKVLEINGFWNTILELIRNSSCISRRSQYGLIFQINIGRVRAVNLDNRCW